MALDSSKRIAREKAIVRQMNTRQLRRVYNSLMPRRKPELDKVNAVHHLPALCVCHGVALDIGCGNGEMLLGLFTHGRIDRGVGIDISDAMISNAKRTAENIRIDKSDVTFIRTALEDYRPRESFDTVIASDVLEHLVDVRCSLNKMHSMLNTGGLLVGITPQGRQSDNLTHLHYFEKENLLELLNPLFARVEIYTPYSHNFYFACWKEGD